MVIKLTCTLLCGFLWALGGSGYAKKVNRRVLVGLTIALAIWLITQNYLVFLIVPLMFGATSVGYGRPDSSDEGSATGKFWFRMVRKPSENRFNQCEMTAFLTNFLTRTTVAILYSLALLPLLFIGNWILGAIFIILNTLCWAVYLKCDDRLVFGLSVEEFLIGAGIAVGAFLSII